MPAGKAAIFDLTVAAEKEKKTNMKTTVIFNISMKLIIHQYLRPKTKMKLKEKLL